MAATNDPVERAARIIARVAVYEDWDELTERWQDKCRDAARQVLDDLEASRPPCCLRYVDEGEHAYTCPDFGLPSEATR